MPQKIKNLITVVITAFVVVALFYLYFPLHWIDWLQKQSPLTFSSTITTIQGSDTLSSSRTTINNNFANLNADKLQSGNTAAALTITALTTGGITETGAATSTFTGGISASAFAANGTATSTFANGIQIMGGCLYFNGVCLASTVVSSVSNSDGTLTVSPTTGNVVASLNTGNANTWTTLQKFSSLSSYNSATTTFSGDINSGGLIGAKFFNATSTTATSTFMGGTVMQYATTTNLTVSGSLTVSSSCTGCSKATIVSSAMGNFDGATPSVSTGTVSCTAPKVVASCSLSAEATTGAVGGYTPGAYPSNSTTCSATQYGANGSTVSPGNNVYAICINP